MNQYLVDCLNFHYNINLDQYGCGRVGDHPIQLIENLIIRYGCPDNFDRWANSELGRFDLNTKKGVRKFKRWLRVRDRDWETILI